MNDATLGVALDLTQHVPLVAMAKQDIGTGSRDAVIRAWPPRVELASSFRRQLPSCLLPLWPGEPLIAGNAAAKHRRSAGLSWPPEAQMPYDGEPACGIARMPLAAAWAAILPRTGEDDKMEHASDWTFAWSPGGRTTTARAAQMLGVSAHAFLHEAGIEPNSCLTAIIVPDALGEAGQQLLIDSLSQAGFITERTHLVPRPIAAAVYWCQTSGTTVADARSRLRLLTLAMDGWEAASLELRRFEENGRTWLLPVRNRAQLRDKLPELPWWGTSIAFALSTYGDGNDSTWWRRLFASDWFDQRLGARRDLDAEEMEAIRAVRQLAAVPRLNALLATAPTLKPLWDRIFDRSGALSEIAAEHWKQQEKELGTSGFSCSATIAGGSLARLGWHDGLSLGEFVLRDLTRGDAFCSDAAFAARGAALVAASLAYDVPCYRETLLPLDLYVADRDANNDPIATWKPLVSAESVEAGRLWRSPQPVTGLKIQSGQDRLALPLRRQLGSLPSYRSVSTELAKPMTCDEPVRVKVKVRPGQGFAQVYIESVTPGLFATRLDWRTMETIQEPKRPALAYLPGVSRIVSDRQMFEEARPVIQAALNELRTSGTQTSKAIAQAIRFLNQWPLAHVVEMRRRNRREKNFFLHYGVLGSDGRFDLIPDPQLATELHELISAKFADLVDRGFGGSPFGKRLLRVAGWLYLAMPQPCYAWLRQRVGEATRRGEQLTREELHAIGLAFEAPDDLRPFFSLLVRRLAGVGTVNEWLRATRNISRFRNHALAPHIIATETLLEITRRILSIMRQEVVNAGRIFSNCLETLPFLLKRRRYEPDFLDPESPLARKLIDFLEELDGNLLVRIPKRLQAVPRSTIKFLERRADESDIGNLLGIDDEEGASGHA